MNPLENEILNLNSVGAFQNHTMSLGGSHHMMDGGDSNTVRTDQN